MAEGDKNKDKNEDENKEDEKNENKKEESGLLDAFLKNMMQVGAQHPENLAMMTGFMVVALLGKLAGGGLKKLYSTIKDQKKIKELTEKLNSQEGTTKVKEEELEKGLSYMRDQVIKPAAKKLKENLNNIKNDGTCMQNGKLTQAGVEKLTESLGNDIKERLGENGAKALVNIFNEKMEKVGGLNGIEQLSPDKKELFFASVSNELAKSKEFKNMMKNSVDKSNELNSKVKESPELSEFSKKLGDART